MKHRYTRIFIGLLLFYVGFLVINIQIVGQAAVPAVNKTITGMQPRDSSEDKPADLKYEIKNTDTGKTLQILGGQKIKSPKIDKITNPTPTWPWYGDEQLQDITTIEIVKPLTIIGDMSEIFARMPKLKDIVLDKGASIDTTGVTSFYRVFYQDSAIKSLDLSKIQGFSLDSADNFSRVFEEDNSLKSVTLPKNVDQVKDFSGLFNNCSNLTTINGINSWTGSSATDVSYMFNGATKLEKLDLAKFNPSQATNFSFMFAGCQALTSVGDLSQWNLTGNKDSKATDTEYNVYSVSHMFDGDSSLKTLDLPNFSPINVQYFSSMFEGCSSLKTITGMNSWDVSSAIFMDKMFAECTKLEDVGDLSKWTGSEATSVSYMFDGDSSLKTLDLSNFNPKKVQYFSYMFAGCSGLTTITGINSWDASSAIFMDRMFEGDTNLKSLTLNNSENKSNGENLRSVEGAINGCSRLTRLDISKLNLTQAVRTAFLAGCNNLWYLKLGPNSVLTNSSLPNAPGPENPQGYPANISSYFCNTNNWQVFAPPEGKNIEEALQNPNNLQDKKTYTTQDLINNTLQLKAITTYIWEPVFRGVVLKSVTTNIDFQKHFLTPTSVDLSDSVNFTVEDSRYSKKNAWQLGAKIVPKTTSSNDEHLTKIADDPILFTNEKGQYIRNSQASLQLNNIPLTNIANIFYTRTSQDSTSPLSQINNNFQSLYDETDPNCTLSSTEVVQTKNITSILKFSTKNAFALSPGIYNTTIEYTVYNSV